MLDNTDLYSEIKTVLMHCISNINKSKTAFLATMDGHMLVDVKKSDLPTEHIPPLGGSILGVADAISTQIMSQNLNDVIIMMEDDVLALMKIDCEGDTLFLGLICERMVSLGLMITHGRNSKDSIVELLNE